MTKVSDVVAPYCVQQIANEKTRPVVPLLEVIELNPRKFSNPPTDDEPVSFVPMKAVEEESGYLDPSEVRPWSEVRKGYTPFEEGDVIFAKITPCMENGKYALAQKLIGGRAAGSTEFHVLRPKPSLDSKYLLYYLLRIELRQSARQSMRGAAGQLRVPPIFFEGLSIPLPSLDEQRRIVAEIEEQLSRLEAGVAALKRVQANLKRYRTTALRSVFTGGSAGNDLPSGWRWSTLGEQFHIGVGATPSRKEPAYWGGSIRWVSSGEVQFCRIRETSEHITDQGLANSSTRINPRGSVLLAMIGQGRTRGQAAILEIEAANNQNCAAIWVGESETPPEFIYYWLMSEYEATRQVGSGNNQQALNKSLVQALPIPWPPLAEQHKIVTEIERRLSVVEETETQVHVDLARAERLRASVLSMAFQ